MTPPPITDLHYLHHHCQLPIPEIAIRAHMSAERVHAELTKDPA